MEKINLTAKEVEAIMQEARENRVVDGELVPFVNGVEKSEVKNHVAYANQGGKQFDKKMMIINPMFIHIPHWQRTMRKDKAMLIGENYNPAKWDAPKIILINGRLYCIDGQHRIFGAYLSGIEFVVVELLEMTEEEAINLFLNQTADRTRMTPSDYYNAAIAAKKPEYLLLKEICTENNVYIKGDVDLLENPVGIFTALSDGVNLARSNSALLDRILKLLGKLEWNGGNDNTYGNAYNTKIIRIMKKLYAYNKGSELALEACLIGECGGSEYFNTNLSKKRQDGMFDHLCKVINDNIDKYRISNAINFPHITPTEQRKALEIIEK